MTLATREGTRRFVDRAIEAGLVHPSTYADGPRGVACSTIGIGTYLGTPDDATDARYEAAVRRALAGGINVVDTAVNYRDERSERAIGRVLSAAFAAGTLARDEVVVATKIGFIPYDAASGERHATYLKRAFVDTGVLAPGEIVGGHHALSGAFVRWGLARSLANLRLDAVDVHFLHNPETQLDAVPRETFAARLRDAAVAMEEACASGRVGVWGVATWDGLRVPPGSRNHVSLEEIAALAREVAGTGHHFGAIELPYSLAMPQALTRATQLVGGRPRTVLEAAGELGLAVLISGPLAEGKLARGLPPGVARAIPEQPTDAARALEFVRSTPGVTSALVGTASVLHVDEALAILRAPRGDATLLERRRAAMKA